MNLLPSNIIRRRQTHDTLKKMAAKQLVIFLAFVLFILAIDLIIRSREGQIAVLETEMQSERFERSEAVVQALREHHTLVTAQQDAAILLNVPYFDARRLDMISETLPAGVRLVNIEMEESGAVLTAESENLSLADIHRDNWAETGLVSLVHLSYVNIAGDGPVRYMLSMHWIQEQVS